MWLNGNEKLLDVFDHADGPVVVGRLPEKLWSIVQLKVKFECNGRLHRAAPN